jgi:nucleolar GTP-binding protein
MLEHFMLDNPDWKYDHVPEIMDGKNIYDFVDADILQRLEELEREEEMIGDDIDEEMPEDEKALWRARKVSL